MVRYVCSCGVDVSNERRCDVDVTCPICSFPVSLAKPVLEENDTAILTPLISDDSELKLWTFAVLVKYPEFLNPKNRMRAIAKVKEESQLNFNSNTVDRTIRYLINTLKMFDVHTVFSQYLQTSQSQQEYYKTTFKKGVVNV